MLCAMVLHAGPLNVRIGHGAHAEHAVLHCSVQEKVDRRTVAGFPDAGGGQ